MRKSAIKASKIIVHAVSFLFIGFVVLKLALIHMQQRDMHATYRETLEQKLRILTEALKTTKKNSIKRKVDLVYAILASTSITNNISSIRFSDRHSAYLAKFFTNEAVDLSDTAHLCLSKDFGDCKDKYSKADESISIPAETVEKLTSYFNVDLRFYSQYFIFWTDINTQTTDSSVYLSIEPFAKFKRVALRLFKLILAYLQSSDPQNMDLLFFSYIHYADEELNINNSTIQSVRYIYTVPSFKELPGAKIDTELLLNKKSEIRQLGEGGVLISIMVSENGWLSRKIRFFVRFPFFSSKSACRAGNGRFEHTERPGRAYH